jgi:hypothetical protein
MDSMTDRLPGATTVAIWGPIRAISAEELAAENAEDERQQAEMPANLCSCDLTGSMPYLLEIEENRITDLKCAGCGKSLASEWVEDVLSTTAGLPVTVKWVRGRAWDELADTLWGKISPRTDSTWQPRRRSAAPPRKRFGQVVTPWISGALCVGIVTAIMTIGGARL